MSTNNTDSSILLEMKNVSIEGYSDETWHPIINEVDFPAKKEFKFTRKNAPKSQFTRKNFLVHGSGKNATA